MAKNKTIYVCQNCSAQFSRWQGQCDQCQSWNSLVEELSPSVSKSIHTTAKDKLKNIDISEFISNFEKQKSTKNFWSRYHTGLTEFDRVLGSDSTGSGLVSGSVVLIGGEPGIGKSTLLSQMIVELSKKSLQSSPTSKNRTQKKLQKIWYVCGEESPHQISQRLSRMLGSNTQDSFSLLSNLEFVTTVDVDTLIALTQTQKPDLLIVDSIQTLTTVELLSPAGSLAQVKACADRLTINAKSLNLPTFLIGHVNKDGAIAGPKVLEHIVDAILELSGERGGDIRFLRAIKNRFGATDEVGVFQLVETGLREISNPSELFLEQSNSAIPGSVITCLMEGTRPILTEVQALVVPSQLAIPRRVGRGVDLPRIQILSAVLQKQIHLPLGFNDVFLSVVGGLQAREPALDLALCVAIVSSHLDLPPPAHSIFLGEVGLMGEIRATANLSRRIKEAQRLGYQQIYSRETHRHLQDLFKNLWPQAKI